MASITSSIQQTHYQVTITSDETRKTIVADEPKSIGGQGSGLNPEELLISSLAACTSATLRMYADRKEWSVKEIKTYISIEVDKEKGVNKIHRSVEIIGDLDDSQRNRMLEIAGKCPLHKMLLQPFEITTQAHMPSDN